MTKSPIYDYEHRLEIALVRLQRDPVMRASTRSHIINFSDYCRAEGLSLGRVEKYLNHLKTLNRLLKKPLESARKPDIIALVREIERQPYSPYTKHDFKVTLKKFYRWLRGTEDYPDEVRWIKSTVKNGKKRLPEDLLDETEVLALVNAADNARDRALVFALYETGCRVGELTSLKVKHVRFDDPGALLVVDGKTGMRRLRVIAAAPALASWLEVHPRRDNPEAYLWLGIGTRGKAEPLSYGAIYHQLRKLAARAGIKKRINPHSFRHARATHLATKLTEAQLKELFGWCQDSRQAATYVHLSGRDVDNAILGLYGLRKKEESEESRIKPMRCPRCQVLNSATTRFCAKCGLVMDPEVAVELDKRQQNSNEFIALLLADPRVRKIAKEKMRKLESERQEELYL